MTETVDSLHARLLQLEMWVEQLFAHTGVAKPEPAQEPVTEANGIALPAGANDATDAPSQSAPTAS